MAAFCHFYRMSPSDYWDLTIAEHAALAAYMRDVVRALPPRSR